MTESEEERQALDQDWAKLQEGWDALAEHQKSLVALIRKEAQDLAAHMLEKKLAEVRTWLEKAGGPTPDVHVNAPITVNVPKDLVSFAPMPVEITVEPTIPVEVKPVLPVNVRIEPPPTVPVLETETLVERDEMGRITSTRKRTGPAGAARKQRPDFYELIQQ